MNGAIRKYEGKELTLRSRGIEATTSHFALPHSEVKEGPQVLADHQLTAITLGVILLVALGLWAMWVPNKPLWTDEFLSLYTGSAPDVESVIRIQQLSPVSLDPPGYHVITHFFISVLGPSALAARLPSLLGWLMMLACFFLFCRRLVNSRFAIFCIALSLPTAEFSYAGEARPYALVLGMAALGLVCWQSAVRDPKSCLAPFGLALALWIALLSHYLSVLLLIPFALTELARWLRARSIDWRITAALTSTVVPIASWLPFLPAASSYKTQYYSKTHLSQLVEAYARLVVPRVQAQLIPLVGALVIAAIAFGLISLIHKYGTRNLPVDWFVVAILAFLPLFGVGISFVAIGGFESRYVVAALLGIAPLCAVSVETLVSRRWIFVMALACVLLVTCAVASMYAKNDGRRLRGLRNAHLTLMPDWAGRFSNLSLVISNLHQYLQLRYYARFDHELLYIADTNLESKWVGNDTLDRTAINLRKFTSITALDFCRFISSHPQFLLTDQPNSEEWLPRQLPLYGARLETVGHLGTMQLDLITVSERTVHDACPLNGTGQN